MKTNFDASFPPPVPQLLLDAPKPRKVTILLAPHPGLSEPCVSVDDNEFGDARQLVSDLATAMYTVGGVGLSAPQIKVLKRVFVVDLFASPRRVKVDGREVFVPRKESELLVAVNPEVTWESDETEVVNEGCLSYPNVTIPIRRPMRVCVRARYHTGEWWETEFTHLIARAVQHEIDHLNGVTMMDRADAVTRKARMKQERNRLRLVHGTKKG